MGRRVQYEGKEEEAFEGVFLEMYFIFSERLMDPFLGQMNSSDDRYVDLWLEASEDLVNIYSSHKVSWAWQRDKKGRNTWEWQCPKSPSKLGQSLSIRAESCRRGGKFW